MDSVICLENVIVNMEVDLQEQTVQSASLEKVVNMGIVITPGNVCVMTSMRANFVIFPSVEMDVMNLTDSAESLMSVSAWLDGRDSTVMSVSPTLAVKMEAVTFRGRATVIRDFMDFCATQHHL